MIDEYRRSGIFKAEGFIFNESLDDANSLVGIVGIPDFYIIFKPACNVGDIIDNIRGEDLLIRYSDVNPIEGLSDCRKDTDIFNDALTA